MIEKMQPLGKLNAKNKIIIVNIILLSNLTSYVIYKEKYNPYNETRKRIELERGLDNGLNLSLTAYYNAVLAYETLGYTKLDKDNKKAEDYYNEYVRINNLEHPRPMGIYTKNNYANRILERDWYYTTYHGCPERMLIRRTESTYYEDSRFDFFTSTRWSNSYMPIRNWMESGELYEIILNEDGTILLLDIVCDLPFKERLEKMKKLKLDDKTILAEYKPISGSLAIQNATRKAVKEGAEGIVLTAADKMYRQGETSSLLRIFSGIQDRMECKVVDAVDDSHIIIDTGKEFVTMQYNNANDVIGKKLEIYSYDGEFYGHKVCDE